MRVVMLLSRLLPVCLLGLLVTSAFGRGDEALYEPFILAAAQDQGLDPALIKAVIKCESGFNPRALSPKGAQGLMQLMPGTQAMLGVTQPFEPQSNIAGGSRYLAMLKQMFSGDLRLILAGYNAGPQTVISAGYTVPAISETQQYIRCVLAAYEQYRQPGTLPLLTPLRPSPPRLMALTPRGRPPVPSTDRRTTLAMQPLRLSSPVAQLGQRLTVEVEAMNASPRLGYGLIMLNYPEHLVSFMAMHTGGYETTVQLPDTAMGAGTAGVATYRLLSSHWQAWAPGERRTARIVLVPRVPQEMTLHVSVVLDEQQAARGVAQRWSTVLRIPFQPTTVAERPRGRDLPPRR